MFFDEIKEVEKKEIVEHDIHLLPQILPVVTIIE